MDNTQYTPKFRTILIGTFDTPIEDIYAALRQADQPGRTDWRALPAYKPATGRGLSWLQQDMERRARYWEARR